MAGVHPFDTYLLDRDEDSDIRVAEAALLFARDRYPGLEPAPYLRRLDALAERVGRLGASSPEDRAAALRQVLVEEEGFEGNRRRYYDPANSYLNAVLDRKLGIPISLSAVWLDVAHQIGWPFAGVGLPGHFVIGVSDGSADLWVDPFGGGRALGRAACEKLVARAIGRSRKLPDEAFETVPNRLVLTRMLNNLRLLYLERGHWHDAACAIEGLLAIHPDSDELRQDLRTARVRHAGLN
ncbi:MAG: transglutaminase-like domain-containing protein [Planctomycetales bacterium]|nr:transglutaminase-like domain-containing protein [Planctomycetales bacterium]